MRRTVYNNGYRDGQKNILNGMTYKIGHILMWLPVKLKRLLFKDEQTMDKHGQISVTIAIFVWKMCNGGIERLVSLLIPVLNGIGFRTVLLTNEAPTPQDYPIAGENPRRYVLPLDGEARQSELDRIFETEHIDVFFAHSFDCKTLDDDFKTARKRGIRTLLTWHSSFTATVLQECDRYFEQYQVAISADMVLT